MNATNEAEFPWTIDLDVFGTPKSKVGTWTVIVDTLAILNGRLQDTPAQNDEIAWDIRLAKGTWTVELLSLKGNAQGIYTLSLDGSSIGTLDGYAASNVRNQSLVLTGVAVSTSKVYEFKVKMATKNASSSNYEAQIQAIRFLRTA